jgi:hypothetical protein
MVQGQTVAIMMTVTSQSNSSAGFLNLGAPLLRPEGVPVRLGKAAGGGVCVIGRVPPVGRELPKAMADEVLMLMLLTCISKQGSTPICP